MTDHQWDKTHWDTTRVSFVTGHNPLFFNCSQAASKFNAHLHSKLLAKKIKILIFWLVFTSPQVQHPPHTVSTKAYTVKVLLSEDLTLMLQASSSNTLANHIRACPIHSLPQVSWWAWKSQVTLSILVWSQVTPGGRTTWQPYHSKKEPLQEATKVLALMYRYDFIPA